MEYVTMDTRTKESNMMKRRNKTEDKMWYPWLQVRRNDLLLRPISLPELLKGICKIRFLFMLIETPSWTDILRTGVVLKILM